MASQSVAHDEHPPLSSPTHVPSVTCVQVKCGTACGTLHIDKIKAPGNKGNLKCILSNSMWYSPIDFESLGGKVKSRNWKRSITYDNVQLGVYLSSIGIHPDRATSPCPGVTTPCHSNPTHQNHTSGATLVDTSLAFIKAYRLKGDTCGLKQAVLSVFDAVSLSAAHKSLWDVCGNVLRDCGLTYHSRRSSDKRPVVDALLDDILVAFDKLDTAGKLPAVYCEANELIRLPSLVIDPISVKLDSHTVTLNSLAGKVDNLPALLATPSAVSDSMSKCCSSFGELVSDIQSQLTKLSSSVTSFSRVTERLSSSNPPQMSSANSGKPSQITSSATPQPLRDRSNNIILFGLPESSLLSMKSAIDDMSTHLIGKSIRVTDAFRLGRRGEVNSQSRPRPVLIKLESCWDKRLLLASCRKLKGYSDHKLFIREDLPPEARANRRSTLPSRRAVTESSASIASNNSSTPHTLSIQTSVPGESLSSS